MNNESLICSADDISKELKDEGKILKTSQVKEEKEVKVRKAPAVQL